MEGSKSSIIEKKFNVLIVDDAPGIRMMHNALLKSFGSNVETQVAENGKVAVDLCNSGKYFDIIFIDKHMPIMDGVQATRKLREMGVASVIVGITSCDTDDEVKPFVEAGLNECFEKPLTREKIKFVFEKFHKDG
ncbi:two-component response regulator ARR22-like [Punica granatum]|uniref:Two-component response regulator ARR22-like n=1 Tax=Punica granatum TaxID=22663 RepID=A0A218W6X6_PUNGR|nr:two-component response regulator ARR22-like [Punica granatum]OWM67981.1 hypothetical protein CDL15_Pgr017549 [Punica granatum]